MIREHAQRRKSICKGVITHKVVKQLFHNILGDVWVANGAHTCAFLVELDYTRFEKNCGVWPFSR